MASPGAASGPEPHGSEDRRKRWPARVRSAFRSLGPFRAPACVLLTALVIFSLLRLGLLLAYVAPTRLGLSEWVQLLWVGFRFDLLVGLCLVLWQTAHVALVPSGRLTGPASRLLFELEWFSALVLLPLLCIVEVLFFQEFESRLNYIAFEYLVYPTEVACNIWESYAVVPYLAAVFGFAVVSYALVRRRLLSFLRPRMDWKRRWLVLASVVGTAVGLWATTGMESREFSQNRLVVECAGNGLYNFVYYALTCRFNYDCYYVTLGKSELRQVLRAEVVGPTDELVASANPVDRIVHTGRPRRDWNVVVVLEESFGANFVGVLGDDRGLTPEFDRLSREGLLFNHFFATGNRTARALEALLASFPPIPTEAILKRDHSRHVYTLADVLQQRGYERLFLTCGRGLFDGVRSFMTNNGFDRFVEQSDYTNPVFENAWGVSDEDMFRRALKEMDSLHRRGRPFFALLLTVSNHRPYTYPPGRIPETGQSRANAVKYADWALGYFFREAKKHAFYANTLFVVLGDHGARVTGSQLFPMASYRVPLLMIFPEGLHRGERCTTLGCTLDVGPTILARLGGDYRSVFFGQDLLTTPPEKGRAVMQHNHDVAVLDPDNRLTVLGFNKKVTEFDMDPTTFELTPVRLPEPGRVRRVAALFQSAYELYYAERWFPADASPAVPRRSFRRLARAPDASERP